MTQGGAADCSSHLPVYMDISSGEAEYIFAEDVCVKASHHRMLSYDLRFLGISSYDGDTVPYNMIPQ